ncbi:endonuclease/Exonuclease/phosphatase family protein [Sarocladium implicatum]|nr:endonuclease/Exonuclease/phosphatase family protein [Sarocladium implicatum]
MALRITTWNVNGIRNPFGYQPWRENRTFQSMFDILEADIVIMQETKIQRKDLKDDMVLVPGWDVYFSLPKHKKGYSGVAIYTRNSRCAPIRAEEGVLGVLTPPKSSTRFCDLPEDQQIGGYPRPGQLVSEVDDMTLDSEGRCVILEFPGFVLFGVYSPATRDESRDDFRISFFQALDVRIRNLVKMGKEVILTGDLNVIRSAQDTSNLVEALRKEDMTMDDWLNRPTRRIFNQLIFDGNFKGARDEGRDQPVLWDLTRCFHPDRQGMNTCWDTKRNTRPANNGSRIDYVLCSDGLKKWFSDSNIQEGLMGSDHCPVYADMSSDITIEGTPRHLLDLVNPSDMVRDGLRLRDWTQKDLLPLSARLIPEFDGRRSIRDMFTRAVPTIISKQELHAKSSQSTDSNAGLQTPTRAVDIVSASPPSKPAAAISDANACADTSAVKPSVAPKRIAEPIDVTARASKKVKPSSDLSKRKIAPGQKTLQGFFKRENAPATSVGGPDEVNDPVLQPPVAPSRSPTQDAARQARAMQEPRPTATTPTSSPHRSASGAGHGSPASASGDKVFDPIEAKESWSRLLRKRVVPRCEHNEPCISLLTKKPGVNCGESTEHTPFMLSIIPMIHLASRYFTSSCFPDHADFTLCHSIGFLRADNDTVTGRSFYICPRPLGPSGEKERGSEWRCGTFIWSSDWNGDATG